MKKISTKRRQIKHAYKIYSKFNLELYKKGAINKELYEYNKEHMMKNKNVSEIKRLFEPFLNGGSMKQFLRTVEKDVNTGWIEEKLWFKSNEYSLRITESSLNGAKDVVDRVQRRYNGDWYQWRQAVDRYKRETEKENR